MVASPGVFKPSIINGGITEKATRTAKPNLQILRNNPYVSEDGQRWLNMDLPKQGIPENRDWFMNVGSMYEDAMAESRADA